MHVHGAVQSLPSGVPVARPLRSRPKLASWEPWRLARRLRVRGELGTLASLGLRSRGRGSASHQQSGGSACGL